jgi:glycosyltransferase involved in cell wall biosynthesis
LVLSINQLIFSRKLKPDIVIGFNYTTHLPSWLIAKLHHCPAIAWYPDVLLGKWKKYFGITGLQGYLAEKIILALPWDQFIAISQKTKSLLIKQNIPSSKITVINPAINPVFFSKSKKTKKDQLLIVSRLAKYKNISEAIKIFSQVVLKQPQVKLIIVGTGPQTKAIKALIKTYQLQDKTVFKHNLSFKQLKSLINQSKVILHPSLIEGFGLTPLEAAAAGCVPLVKSSTVSKQIHPPAFYYHSINQAVNRLSRLLSDPKYFHQQSSQAQKLALSFTVSKMINRFNKLLRQYAKT